MLKLKGECSLGIRDWTILWPLCGILWLNFDGIASLKLIFSTILLLLYTIFLLHVLQFLKKTLANNQQKLQLKYFWLLNPFVIFFIRHRKAGT